MAKITRKEIESLLDALRGTTPTAPRARTEPEKYHVGAVWSGNWFRHADKGKFGSSKKPRHFACVMKRPGSPVRFFTLAPITSKRHRKNAVFLPAGVIPGTQFTASWILPRVKLRASRTTLDTKFEYTVNLPATYVKEMREIMTA